MNKVLLCYYISALKLKLPVTYLNNIDCLKITLGRHHYLLNGVTPTLNNNASSIYLTKNKYKLNRLLLNAGFPVPKVVYIHRSHLAGACWIKSIQELTFPVLVNPMLNMPDSREVICNIQTPEHLFSYIKEHPAAHFFIQMAAFQPGYKAYRILTLKGRVLGVVQCIAQNIVGDAENTIEDLISKQHQNNSETLKSDESIKNHIENQGLSFKSIPENGVVVPLRYEVSRALGGYIVSCGTNIHPQNAKLLSQAANLIGLDLVGFDLLCNDITKPLIYQKWTLAEVTYAPDLTLHEFPDEGAAINVCKKILMKLVCKHPFTYCYHRFKSARALNG